MNLSSVKNEIHLLAERHHALVEVSLDDFKEAELLEIEAESLIISYCEKMGYQINGFPIDKRIMYAEHELDEDYFCRERFQLYLDMLTLEKKDIEELTWCYVSVFWPEQFSDKQEFLMTIKEQIECGVFYDVEL